jgi:hypothetical protein
MQIFLPVKALKGADGNIFNALKPLPKNAQLQLLDNSYNFYVSDILFVLANADTWILTWILCTDSLDNNYCDSDASSDTKHTSNYLLIILIFFLKFV